MKRTANSVCGMLKPLSEVTLGLVLWALSLGYYAPAQLVAITEVVAEECRILLGNNGRLHQLLGTAR